jgi:hypothetical protein
MIGAAMAGRVERVVTYDSVIVCVTIGLLDRLPYMDRDRVGGESIGLRNGNLDRHSSYD